MTLASAAAGQGTPPTRPPGSAARDTVHRYGEKVILTPADSIVIRMDTVWLPRKAAPPEPAPAQMAPPEIQAPPADTTWPIAVISVGTSGMFGGFTVLDKEPGGRISTRREHHYGVAGAVAGIRHESKTFAVGLRGEVFKGNDMGGAREVVTGFRTKNAQDSAFTIPVKGISGMIDVDLRNVGVSAGMVAGDLLNNRNHPTQAQKSPAFAGAIRFGWLQRVYGEVSIFDHSPAAVPGPVQKLSLTQLDDNGTRYRIGVTDTGPFAEVRWLAAGWEVAPFVSAGENLGFNLTLALSRRIGVR